MRGESGGEPPGSAAVYLAVAELLFEREDLGGAADRSVEALDMALAEGHLLTAGGALSLLVATLYDSIFEEPPSVNIIALARRGAVVHAIERGISAIDPDKLPSVLRRRFADVVDVGKRQPVLFVQPPC